MIHSRNSHYAAMVSPVAQASAPPAPPPELGVKAANPSLAAGRNKFRLQTKACATLGRLLVVGCLAALAALAQGPWTGSKSNGSDGALVINASTPGVNNGVYLFDPVALGKDVDGDNIYHFTTITLTGISEVRLLQSKMRRPGPVVWLATGNVIIGTKLNLSGSDGHPASASLRAPSEPGPGGFPGGMGATSTRPAQAGFGPGGGKLNSLANASGCSASFAGPAATVGAYFECVKPDYGNSILQPLIGGSGGAGATEFVSGISYGGGAGGGAIRVSSDTLIAFGTGVDGSANATGCSAAAHAIDARGGAGGRSNNHAGGGGSGGAVHLQSPIIAGCGTHLLISGGASPYPGPGSSGRIRLDTTSLRSVTSDPAGALTGPLVNIPLPTAAPVVRLTSIGGQPTPANPSAGYTVPDVNIDSSAAVPVAVAASYIPVGTPVTLILIPDVGSDLTANMTLAGTLENSTATVNVAIPRGVSRLFVRAVW